MSNGIKYSPSGTEVIVSADVNPSGIIIKVRDEGFGIPADMQEKIFEKFYRMERDTAQGIVGTGLGLPLVKEIVELHGGRITVESSQGAGPTFIIHLPSDYSYHPV